jgi:hypothetical protein
MAATEEGGVTEAEAGSSGLTTARFPAAAQYDRSAIGLDYQHAQIDLAARGTALGRGRRVAPAPDALFSRPAISQAQFGGGGGAKSMMGQE